MDTNAGTRPTTGTEPRGKESTDNRGGRTVGPAGKIRRAWDTAPDGATADAVQSVAMTAWQEDRDPADVWGDGGD